VEGGKGGSFQFGVVPNRGKQIFCKRGVKEGNHGVRGNRLEKKNLTADSIKMDGQLYGQYPSGGQGGKKRYVGERGFRGGNLAAMGVCVFFISVSGGGLTKNFRRKT